MAFAPSSTPEHWAVRDTALGPLALGYSGRGICRVQWPPRQDYGPGPMPEWMRAAWDAVTAFLSGLGPFPADLPLDLDGLSPFRQAVYLALQTTEPGCCLTYAQLAYLSGHPGAARAVGQALRRNPLPILVPCHRVVGGSGPGAYSFPGGLELKRRLMLLEHTEPDDALVPR